MSWEEKKRVTEDKAIIIVARVTAAGVHMQGWGGHRPDNESVIVDRNM